VSPNANQEVISRFGSTAAKNVVVPILEKLWLTDATKLSRHALHCFFDLRRMVICDKPEADQLKDNSWLDSIVANPLQSEPKGKIYDGRIGLTFKSQYSDLTERFILWAEKVGIEVQFGSDIAVVDGCLTANKIAVHEQCDACIVSMSMHSLASTVIEQTDQLEMSIYYMQLKELITDQFPAYYVLCHDTKYKSSRIVNYDAYNHENSKSFASVLAVEVVHGIGDAPSSQEIAQEVMSILPSLCVDRSYRLERGVKICTPSLKNGELLDSVKNQMEGFFHAKPVYFTGMRTDTGVFFSHHTIGLAYDAALECSRRLL
jgi:hypothetical protein